MDNTEKKVLAIYESPNKHNLFKRLFREAGISCDFAYTQGRIFDLPVNKLGLHKDGNMDIVPVDQKRFNYLQSKINDSDIVLCLTDMDEEGEWIADSIKRICFNSQDTNFLRLKLNEYTKDSLINALESSTESLNHDAISVAQSRRYIDRLIGYADNDDKDCTRGRVLSPFIQSIYEDPIQLRKKVELKADNTYISFKTALPDNVVVDVISTNLQAINNSNATPIDPRNSLPNTYECLQYQLTRLQASNIEDAAHELQELYELGFVSYPRTESSRYKVYEGQHSGIRSLELEDESDSDDSLLTFIKKRTLFAKENRHSIKRLEIDTETETKLNNLGVFEVTAYTVNDTEKDNVLSIVSPYRMLNNVGNPLSSNGIELYSYQLSLEQRLLERLKNSKLAQPSTLHLHVSKIKSYVHEDGNAIMLNTRGVKVAVQGDWLSNIVKNIDNAHEINGILNKNGLSVDDKIAKCLNIIYQKDKFVDENDFQI